MKIKGRSFTLLLTDRGEVYSWGYNTEGQLGIGTDEEYYHMPTKIKFVLDIPIKYISAGTFHAAAIDFEYNVYIWGFGEYGNLCLEDGMDRCNPAIIKCLKEKKVEKIYCDNDYTIALTQNGEVYSWGINRGERLEIGNYKSAYTLTKLNFPNNTIIKKLYMGKSHAYAIDTCSKIYYWGYNCEYLLCNSDIQQNSPSIANMLEGFNVKKIICLEYGTIILADNKLYSMGYSYYYGELDIGEANKITLVKDGAENVWGNNSTVFCKMCNGDIYAWGLNYKGQLGIGNIENQKSPVKLNIQLDIKNINYCGDATYAITTSGEIYTWGIDELVNKKLIMEPTLFTYFMDNGIEVKAISHTKSAKKIDY